MTHLTLTLSNYLTSPIEALLSGLKTLYVKLQNAQMTRAIVLVRKEMMKHKMYRETYNALAKLSDKELRDIGLSRGEIHSVSMEAYFDNRIG